MQTAIAKDGLKDLNEAQRQAVINTEGPCLIVAGPGSGKTRVITHRIVHLIENLERDPRDIVAVTFTNRAAREMLDRASGMLGHTRHLPEIKTFHSLCAKRLRIDGEVIGLAKNFSILDDDDQAKVMRAILTDMNLKGEKPRDWLDRISKAKSKLMAPTEAANATRDPDTKRLLRIIYQRYQNELERCRGVDFDDLIMLTVRLLQESPEARARIQNSHRYLMVDEFQDTNVAQYELCKLLSQRHRNICVVGDPDQSVYSWRSAEPRNIEWFQRDHPGCVTTALGQNYRSTGRIVESADCLIRNNPRLVENSLFTENGPGREIGYEVFGDEDEEAETIVREIRLLTREHGYQPNDCAVLYRTNAASRPIEKACLDAGVRYRIIGGTTFYRRKEVRDTLAYLRLMENQYDRMALDRVINTPPRKLGPKSLNVLNAWSREMGVPMYEGLERITRYQEGPRNLPKSAVRPISDFVGTLDMLRRAASEMPLHELIHTLLRETRLDELIHEGSTETNDRWENIVTLMATAEKHHSGPANANLGDFLENAALMAQEDFDEATDEAVTLITLHKSKGTEYPIVFITGLEEGTLPHNKSLYSEEQINEERRLCYVGITRAKERLYLSRTGRTRSFRRFEEEETGNRAAESRFIAEIFEPLADAQR